MFYVWAAWCSVTAGDLENMAKIPNKRRRIRTIGLLFLPAEDSFHLTGQIIHAEWYWAKSGWAIRVIMAVVPVKNAMTLLNAFVCAEHTSSSNL